MSLSQSLFHDRLFQSQTAKEREGTVSMPLFSPEAFAPATILLPPVILAIENDADRSFLTQIYLDYRNLMYKVALSFFSDNCNEAEDIFGAVLEKMCRRPELLRAVPDERKASYIATMTANACRDRLRQMKHGTYAYSLDDGAADYLSDPVDPYTHLFEYSSMTEVLNSFRGLSDRDQDLLRMRYAEEKKIPEIAALLGVKEATVYSALFRARKHLEEILNKEGISREE